MDGVPSTVYDEFWYLNVNWINDDFPAYPDNTPTDAIYNIEFCPCLHTPQHYRNIEGYDFNITFYQYYAAGGSTGNYFDAFMMSNPDGPHTRSAISAISFATVSIPNGAAPGFGYYGFEPFASAPKNLADTITAAFSEETFVSASYAPSDIITTTYKWGLSPHYYARIFVGDLEEDSPYYNPYKISSNLSTADMTSYFQGTLAGGEIYGSNINGFEVSYGSIVEPMGYNAVMYIPSMGSDLSVSAPVIGPVRPETTRGSFSPGQLSIIESIVEEGSSSFQRMLRFSELIDLKNAVYGEDLFTPIYNDLIADVENEDIAGMVGCRNPDAINYNDGVAVGDYRTCILPGESCELPTHIISICDSSSPLSCGEVPDSEVLLDHFGGEETESPILSSEEFPVYEGCTGGGFKYVIDTSLCVYGTITSSECFIGAETTAEEAYAALVVAGVEYSINCPGEETVRTIIPNLHTFGGTYFTATGEYYVGPYSYTSGGVVWAGNIHNTTFRLYTKDQLRGSRISIPNITLEAIQFLKVIGNIENICRFAQS